MCRQKLGAYIYPHYGGAVGGQCFSLIYRNTLWCCVVGYDMYCCFMCLCWLSVCAGIYIFCYCCIVCFSVFLLGLSVCVRVYELMKVCLHLLWILTVQVTWISLARLHIQFAISQAVFNLHHSLHWCFLHIKGVLKTPLRYQSYHLISHFFVMFYPSNTPPTLQPRPRSLKIPRSHNQPIPPPRNFW